MGANEAHVIGIWITSLPLFTPSAEKLKCSTCHHKFSGRSALILRIFKFNLMNGWGWRVPLGSLQSIPCPNQGHVACDYVQSGFEYLHNLSGQPVAILDHPCITHFLFLCFSNFPVFQFFPNFPSPVTEHYCKILAASFIHLFTQSAVLSTIPWSLLFSRLSSPSSHNFSYARCSSPLNISMALHWSHLRYVHISCTGKPRPSRLHFFGSQRILILHLYVQKIRTFHSGK